MDEEERRAGNGSGKAWEPHRGKRGERRWGQKTRMHSLEAAFESLGAPFLRISMICTLHHNYTSSNVSCIWTFVQKMHELLSDQQQTQAPWASLCNFPAMSSLFRIHCHIFLSPQLHNPK